ncbi:MAG: pyridoxal-phosphate dependent enzyme [Saprospiraceae bacterium]|nr:pyridoxal-phosphate dependent enzyme [Saprospiraceae bacterium]
MPSPLTLIAEHPGRSQGITLYLKRDDLLHPVVQGNKWRKMEPAIQAILDKEYEGIITFGGPFSNHLHAVASAGKHCGFPTAAIIRGTAIDTANPTLSHALACGMELIPIRKTAYDTGFESDAVQQILTSYGHFLHLPEGGAGRAAVRNCVGIASEILEQTPDVAAENRIVAIPAGTGSTAAGLIAGLGLQGKTLVFPAAPYGVGEPRIQQYMQDAFGHAGPPFEVIPDYTFGKFAAFQPDLIRFVQDFHHITGILLDPIYTAKMMWGLYDLLKQGFFPELAVIVAVHTGGLQGWDGFKQRFGVQIDPHNT